MSTMVQIESAVNMAVNSLNAFATGEKKAALKDANRIMSSLRFYSEWVKTDPERKEEAVERLILEIDSFLDEGGS